MNKVQASAYCDILREGLNTIVSVSLSMDWQKQISHIYTESTKVLDCIPRFKYRIIESEGVLFVDNRSIENEMPSDVANEFRSLIRAYSILVSTTRYPDNIQFITKRTKVVQMLNKTQSTVQTENKAMAVNVRNQIIFDLSKRPHQPYITFLKQAIGFRRSDATRTLAIMHDRGRKSDYIQTYEYEVNQIRLLVDTYMDTGEWFDSIYLNWFINEIENNPSQLLDNYSFLLKLLQEPSFIVVLSENDYECYGFAMSILTILDKIFFLRHDSTWNNSSSLRIKLLNLAFLSCLMYLNYHKGKDCVRDAEIYSNYARLFDRFREDMPVVLMECGDFSIRYWYYFCWGMFEASHSIPVEYDCAKEDYMQSALMMQQNGTVVFVTGDPLDASLKQAVSTGESLSVMVYKKLVENVAKGEMILSQSDIISLQNIMSAFIKKHEKLGSLNSIKCVSRYKQLMPYSFFGKEECKHHPPEIHYSKLVDQITHDTNIQPSIARTSDGRGYIISVKDLWYCPNFNTDAWRENRYKDCVIFGCHITTDKYYNVKSIYIYGLHLHTLKLDIDRSSLFCGVPCFVTLYDHIGSLDTLNLLIGIKDAIQHGYSNDAKKDSVDKVQIPDAIIRKLDAQRRLNWTESSWENYLDFNLKLVENGKTRDELISTIDKYFDDLVGYYSILGYDDIPSRVFRDLLIDPCLKSFIEYLKKGPELKAKAEQIASDYGKGYATLIRQGIIRPLQECHSLVDYQIIIDKANQIKQRHYDILLEEEREKKRQEQLELDNLKKQVVELYQIYPKGFDSCVQKGYIKTVTCCFSKDDYKATLSASARVIDEHNAILKARQREEEQKQAEILRIARHDANNLRVNYNKGYSYYLQLGFVGSIGYESPLLDCNKVLSYRSQIINKHNEIVESEHQQRLRAECERKERKDRERKAIEERNAIDRLSRDKKHDAAEIRNVLRENNVKVFYHFTDRKNLRSIKELGGLYSWYYLKSHNIPIPNQGGNSFSQSRDQQFGLQDYVRLSFCEDHPMAYRKRQEGADIILLKISLDVAEFESTLFTDANATSNDFCKGADVSAIRKVNFKATREKFMRREDPDFGHKQAEILVKTYLPAKYILNLNEL